LVSNSFLIEKDVRRTDRMTPFFSGDNNERLHQLNDILMTFVMYDFNLGRVSPSYTTFHSLACNIFQ